MARKMIGPIDSLEEEEREGGGEEERERVKKELNEKLMREGEEKREVERQKIELEKQKESIARELKEKEIMDLKENRFNKGFASSSGLNPEGKAGFKKFTIESHSTLPILDGAMKIACGDTSMTVRARICSQEDFPAVSSITENNGVRLKKKIKFE